jgi:hypothetical protein
MYEIWNRIMKLYDSLSRWLIDRILVDDENEDEKEKELAIKRSHCASTGCNSKHR